MKNILIIAGISFFATGCATVVRGTNEAFIVTSNVSNADVQLEQKGVTQTCVTPCSVKIKRKPPVTVSISKDGYEPQSAVVQSSVNGGGAAGMAGNVLVGGFIGAGVDVASGAMHDHAPNPLHFNMIEDAKARTEEATTAD